MTATALTRMDTAARPAAGGSLNIRGRVTLTTAGAIASGTCWGAAVSCEKDGTTAGKYTFTFTVEPTYIRTAFAQVIGQGTQLNVSQLTARLTTGIIVQCYTVTGDPGVLTAGNPVSGDIIDYEFNVIV
jgi:hypothetical protein